MASQPSETPHTGRDREAREAELWDALANVLYDSTLATLPIPCAVDSRLEIHVKADLAAAGTLGILVDGNITGTFTTIPAAGTAINFTVADVSRGTHVIALTSTAATSNTEILVRRGRRPRE